MTTGSERSRVLTLVFTDLADSTALKTEHGDQAVDALLSRHREHVVRLAEECSGRIIDWAGDGCFLTFETSSAAVVFALRLQQTHSDESDLPAVRVGIHLGEVTEQPGPDGQVQVKGLAVDVAARIQGLAYPGQVLMSTAVYNSARQRLGVETFGEPILWQAHGMYELKGFDEPMEIREAGIEGVAPLQAPQGGDKARRVSAHNAGPSKRNSVIVGGLASIIAIALVILVVRSFLPESAPADPTGADTSSADSIAVLYFENLTDPNDPDNLEGTFASLTTFELSSSETLEVLPRQRLYDIGKQLGVGPSDEIDRTVATAIATRAGVRHMVVGTIALAGDQIRVNCDLIHVATSRLVQSFQASGSEDDIFAMAETLGGDLRNHLRHDADATALTERLTASVPAFKAFVRGEIHLHEAEYREAVREFRTAVELDPDFAQAQYWLTIASAWFNTDDMVPVARRLYELIDRFPPADRPAVEATVRYVEDNWTDAFRLIETALELNPHNKEALYIRSEIYFHSPELADLRRSAATMERILEIDPDFDMIFDHLAHCYIILEETEKFEQLMQLGEAKGLEGVARARSWWTAHQGKPEEAIRMLEHARGNWVPGTISRYALAAGQFDLAAEAHEKARGESGYQPLGLKQDSALIAMCTGRFEEALKAWTEYEPPGVYQLDRFRGFSAELFIESKRERAGIFHLNGERERAQEEAAIGVERCPNSFEALYWAGHYALENDDPSAAQGYLEQAQALARQAGNPFRSYYAALLESDINIKQGNYEKARDLILHYLDERNDFDEAAIRTLLSRAYTGLGNLRAAADVLEHMRPRWRSVIDFQRIRAMFALGKLKSQLGETNAARDSLTRYLAYWGDSDWDLDEVNEAKALLAKLEQESL